MKNLRERIALRLCPWLKPEPSNGFTVYTGDWQAGGITTSSATHVRLKATGFGG